MSDKNSVVQLRREAGTSTMDPVEKGLDFLRLYAGCEESAIRCFTQAIIDNPDNTYARSLKAKTLAKLGRTQEALECYSNCQDKSVVPSGISNPFDNPLPLGQSTTFNPFAEISPDTSGESVEQNPEIVEGHEYDVLEQNAASAYDKVERPQYEASLGSGHAVYQRTTPQNTDSTYDQVERPQYEASLGSGHAVYQRNHMQKKESLYVEPVAHNPDYVSSTDKHVYEEPIGKEVLELLKQYNLDIIDSRDKGGVKLVTQIKDSSEKSAIVHALVQMGYDVDRCSGKGHVKILDKRSDLSSDIASLKTNPEVEEESHPPLRVVQLRANNTHHFSLEEVFGARGVPVKVPESLRIGMCTHASLLELFGPRASKNEDCVQKVKSGALVGGFPLRSQEIIPKATNAHPLSDESHLVEADELVSLTANAVNGRNITFLTLDGNDPVNIKNGLDADPDGAEIRVFAINVSANGMPYGKSQGTHWVTYVEVISQNGIRKPIILNAAGEQYSSGLEQLKSIIADYYGDAVLKEVPESLDLYLQSDGKPSCGIWVLDIFEKIKIFYDYTKGEDIEDISGVIGSLKQEYIHLDNPTKYIKSKRQEAAEILFALGNSATCQELHNSDNEIHSSEQEVFTTLTGRDGSVHDSTDL